MWRSTFNSRARCSAGLRSGPSPAISRCAGTLLRTSARIRTQSCTRFTGRKFERWISSFSPAGAYSFAAAFSSSGLINVAIDEILDHPNLVLHAEDLHRILLAGNR